MLVNGMQAQSQIRRRATCIHRARGGGEQDQDPGGEAQAVKAQLQSDPAGSAPHKTDGMRQ